MNYEDYVCGTKFRNLADVWLRAPDIEHWNNFHSSKRLIVYIHTHDFNKNIEGIKKISDEVILITHNSDGAVRDGAKQEIRENDADYSKLPNNVIKWYAQNVEMAEIPSNIVPIPIGLENRYCFDYDKAQMLFNTKPKIKLKKLYVNFNINTNLIERTSALHECEKSNICNIRLGKNGDDYNKYLNELNEHIGAICPRGNGLDCHRTWESLYLGVIPVLKFELSINTFNIPAIWIKNWNELNIKSDEIIENLDKNIIQISEIKVLSMEYWRNRIYNAK